MAVSATAAGASPQTNPFANPFAQARQAFGQLSNALQSGNLSAAQSAYNTLAASPLAQNGPFAQAIQQIGQDLQSGNLADAQKALASLQQQQQQKAHGHHHHHGGIKPPDQTDSTDQTQSSTASQSSATDPDGDGGTDVSAAGGVSAPDNDNKVNITA